MILFITLSIISLLLVLLCICVLGLAIVRMFPRIQYSQPKPANPGGWKNLLKLVGLDRKQNETQNDTKKQIAEQDLSDEEYIRMHPDSVIAP